MGCGRSKGRKSQAEKGAESSDAPLPPKQTHCITRIRKDTFVPPRIIELLWHRKGGEQGRGGAAVSPTFIWKALSIMDLDINVVFWLKLYNISL